MVCLSISKMASLQCSPIITISSQNCTAGRPNEAAKQSAIRIASGLYHQTFVFVSTRRSCIRWNINSSKTSQSSSPFFSSSSTLLYPAPSQQLAKQIPLHSPLSDSHSYLSASWSLPRCRWLLRAVVRLPMISLTAIIAQINSETVKTIHIGTIKGGHKYHNGQDPIDQYPPGDAGVVPSRCSAGIEAPPAGELEAVYVLTVLQTVHGLGKVLAG